MPASIPQIPQAAFPSLSPSKIVKHPLLSGSISRWLWRIWVQRLTRAGQWMVFISAIVVMYGGASLQLHGFVLAGYFGALWIIAAVAMILYRPRVRLGVMMSSRATAGERVAIDIDVEQLGASRGADLVVVAHKLPLELDSSPDAGVALPDLKRGQKARLHLLLQCKKRGSYTVPGFRVESGFPFGILRARRIFEQPKPLVVYPKFTALSRLALPTGRRYQPGGVALASNLGESFEFLGNREYRDGDNIRDIDWRATARVQRPIVREYREEYFLRVAVILDTHIPGTLRRKASERRRQAFEHAISAAASVSDYMARQDYLVDLFAAGPNLYHLTAGRSLAYLEQILDILACVQSNPDEPFETIEPQLAEVMSRISTVICIMLDWNEPRRLFAHRLARQGAAVKIVIVRDEPCTLDPAIDADTLGPIPVLKQDDLARGIDAL